MELSAFGVLLDQHVRPQSLPVAIRMCRDTGEVPPKAKRPARDLGFQAAICQAVALARNYGWTLALEKEDLSCPLAQAVFGFVPPNDFYLEGHACAGLYTASPQAGAATEAQVARFEPGAYAALVVAPVARADFEADVVLVYATPAQVMRLVTAALWKEGGRIRSSFSGRLDCSDGIIETLQSGECQVVLPCYGDRIFAQAQDHEMAFAIPASRLEAVAEGLQGTHKGGVRYPIPAFLRYTAEFPPQYQGVLKPLPPRD
ncbi:MAG: DUF169 domain-containing protein [Acidobacteria bacterium]|nr:DUF169 domain-containing protein [Acidobacteriota bacterium]